MSTLQARATQLQGTLKPEQTYLEGAVNALAGKEPDAALKTRIGNFQRSQQSAAQEIQTQQNQIQRNQAYIRQQLLEKLNSLYTGVMTRRGANMLVEMSSTLAYDPSLDVTADLLAALNAALPSLNTVAPAPAAPAAGTQPSGR
jgi:Skp family chaperone for outer membrane proteins